MNNQSLLVMTALLASATSVAVVAGCSSDSSPSTTLSEADASTPIDAGSTSTPQSDGSTSTPDGGGADSAATPRPAAAFFRGTLAASVDASKASSDPFFNGVEAEAKGAGDNGHDALLGTTHLNTTLNQFVGLDTWSTDANMDAVYSDPRVQSFGASFYAAPPEFKTFFVSDFYQWGNTDSGDATSPHYFVMIRGRFNDTPDKIKPLHDPIAQGAEAQAKTAGEVAHIVYYGRQDPQDALIVDIWSADTNIDSFYADPQLKSSVSSLFDATGPNFGVYSSTDWVTW